ncbi:thiol-disulfide oxidoreductase DCC family protein [Marinilabilia sp.]|uniref:thiol-disulfide oxidoreductase DCC family protein n=1 Tax=Marinilabilia sp. TaxID=2021252 RepID=UPI0025BD62DF|nr:DCC1-like thiol-disulfide oxidoreductase family protein [Marinilabilia sp.]
MIVLFDGFCVLCSGFARWLKKRYAGKIQLEAMQSEKGQELLSSIGYSSYELDEVVVIENEKSLSGAPAILYILKRGGTFPLFLYRMLRILPGSWIKAGYRLVANNRYKWFGRRSSCTIIQD